MIPTLISLTSILSLLLIIAYLNDNDDLKGVSITGLVLVAIFGWGVAAGAVADSHKKEDAKIIELLRGKHIVVVETTADDKDPTIFKGNEIEIINDNTTFYWNVGYNAYGGEVSRELKIK